MKDKYITNKSHETLKERSIMKGLAEGDLVAIGEKSNESAKIRKNTPESGGIRKNLEELRRVGENLGEWRAEKGDPEFGGRRRE